MNLSENRPEVQDSSARVADYYRQRGVGGPELSQMTSTVLGSQVTGNGVLLDGDGDGQAGGDSVTQLHRLFGDSDGDRDVDSLDLFKVFTAFGKPASDPGFLAYFDFDGDGDVDSLDLFRFYQRFGTTLGP